LPLDRIGWLKRLRFEVDEREYLMKICMLCSMHEVSDERVTYKQAVSLAAMGHEVKVYGRGGKDDYVPDVPGLSYEILLPETWGLLARLRVLRMLYKAAVEWKPDVITCHEPDSAIVGLMVRARHKIPVLFDIHECYEETLSARVPVLFRAAVRSGTSKLLYTLGRRCDWLTVVSPATQAFYRAVRSDERITIIHNSPRMELFPPSRQGEAPFVLCHDGYLDESRGMVQMLEAFALARKTTDVRLLLVGKVYPECADLFDRTVTRLGLALSIDMPGWKPYDEIGAIESSAQVGLVTLQPGGNTFKSLNNKLYNYMSCALAVIAPAGSMTEHLVREYDCGLVVDTTKPQDIADAIIRLVQDGVLRKRLGSNGRRAIENDLGWHKMEERLQAVYRALERDSSQVPAKQPLGH
jgi:glycosyltransferase involved in cell wall biosynthesis